MDFTGARDNGVAVASAGPYANHFHLAPVLYHSVLYRPDALPAAQPTLSKHWRHNYDTVIIDIARWLPTVKPSRPTRSMSLPLGCHHWWHHRTGDSEVKPVFASDKTSWAVCWAASVVPLCYQGRPSEHISVGAWTSQETRAVLAAESASHNSTHRGQFLILALRVCGIDF